MSVFQRSASVALRTRLRTFLATFAGEPPTPEDTRIRMEFLQRIRGELVAGQGDLLKMLGPSAAADALGDPDRIAAYAETLAVEAMISEAAGHTERAAAIRTHAVAIAREAQKRAATPDASVDQMISSGGRLDPPAAASQT